MRKESASARKSGERQRGGGEKRVREKYARSEPRRAKQREWKREKVDERVRERERERECVREQKSV